MKSSSLLGILFGSILFTGSIWGLNIRALEMFGVPDELLDHIAIVLDQNEIPRTDYHMT